MRCAATALLAAVLLCAGSASAHALPACAQRLDAPVRRVGAGTLRWFGLRIYRATLWSGRDGLRPQALGTQSLALRLRYARAIGAQQLARSSAELMRGAAPAARVAHWQQRLLQVFPDVHAGDTLCGVYLAHGPNGPTTLFMRGGTLLGSLRGADFARAFFGIWLGPDSGHPRLRRQLLAGVEP